MAALVDKLTDQSVRLVLVNTHQAEERTVLIQAGAYGEYEFVGLERNGRRWPSMLPPCRFGRFRVVGND